MKRLLFLLIAVFLTMIPVAAFADSTLLDLTADQVTELLKVQIPTDTPVGEHWVEIQILDSNSKITNTKRVNFCIDDARVINWSDICLATPKAQPTKVIPVIKFHPKSPSEKAKETIAFLAIMTVLGSGVTSLQGVATSAARKVEESDALSQGAIVGIDVAEFAVMTRAARWGDRKKNWKNRFTSHINSKFSLFAFKTGRISPLASRIMQDGQHLRSMIGSFSWGIYPIALATAIISAGTTRFLAIPPSLLLVSILMIVGIVDSFAGFLAASIIFLGVLFTGNMTTKAQALTMVGLSALYFVPVLIASSIRPLRRLIDGVDSGWERITDYAIAGALTGFTISKMVSGLEGLSGRNFDIANHVNQLTLIGIGAVLLRLLLEDLASYLFPARLAANGFVTLQPNAAQRVFSLLFKIGFFILIAERFIGYSIALWVGTIMVFLPSVIGMAYGQKIKRAKTVGRWIPLGPLQLIIVILLGGILANVLHHYIPYSHRYVLVGFILFVIPAFLIGLLGLLADPEDAEGWRKGPVYKWIYRVGGVIVLIVIISLVAGADITANLINFLT